MIRDIRRVACVGSGLVEQNWAALFALHGYEVVMQDLTEDILTQASKRVRTHIESLVEAGLGNNAERAITRIETTTELAEALNNTDFVQESVYESYEVKKPL